MFKTISIIVVSVSLFGLIVFIIVKNLVKKRIGPMRPDANREIFYKKDLGILARSGFSYDISKKILDMSQKEFLQILKLT